MKINAWMFKKTPNIPARRQYASALTACVAALVLSGCTMLIPDYQQPEAPISSDWPSTVETRLGDLNAPSAAVESWQGFFADERLRQLIAVALDNNRDLRVAALNVEKAQAQFRVQRAAQWPTLNAQMQSQKFSPNSMANSAMYGVGITSYELDLFGRIQSLKEAALAQYLATEETRKATQISLISSIAMAYFNVLANDDLLVVTDETLKTREKSFKLIGLKFDNGIASELDLRQAEGLVESAKASLAQIKRERAQAQNMLVLLLGQETLPVDLSRSEGLILQKDLLAPIPVGLPSELLINRPDIRASEQQLIAANANIGAARAAYFPRIGLTGTFGRSSDTLSNLFDDTTRAWTFSPLLTLPIFDAGANRANLDAAKAMFNIAIAQYEKTIQTAFSEVADALAGTATWEDQLMAMRAQVKAAAKTYELSDLRYKSGVSSYLDVLDSQRNLFAAQQGAIQVHLALLQNQISLYKALGGGWQNEAVESEAGEEVQP